MKSQYDLSQMFADCFLFQHFHQSDYDTIKDLLEWKNIPSGQYIFREGEAYTGFFLVCEGEVEIFKKYPQKRPDLALATVEKGGIFGEIALFLPNGRRSASARARTDVDCCFMPRETFEKLLEENEAVANKIVLAVAKSLSERLDQVTKNALLLKATECDQNHDNRDILKFKQQLAAMWSF